MKFNLMKYELDYDSEPFRITAIYSIANSGLLEITINHEGKPVIETIIKALTKLYREDEITLFFKNMMYKTCNGYYQEYKRF